jgi:RNA polymerase sigma factor (sigma-70 family)
VLVARYTAAAHRTAVVLGAGADAEDVVQEAFVKAFRHLRRFRADAPFRSWLLRIVANETKNLHRSSRRRAVLALRVTEGTVEEILDPEGEVVAGERRDRLFGVVRELPEKDQWVIACRYFLDLSEAETAQVLGWPRGSVKSRTSRALDRLRTRLASLEEVGEEVAGG